MADSTTRERMEQIFDSTRNWGRWGPEDERGALNLITAEKRVAAAACVRSGRSVSCARDLPVHPAVDNPHPALHMMIQGGDDCVVPGMGFESTTDFVGVAFHGLATSHLDALCHVFVKSRMYNGFEAAEVKSTGARRGSVMSCAEGIVTRGVLLDIPRLVGEEWLELGTEITPEQLEAAESAQRVRTAEGDVLLVSTGRDARRKAKGPWNPIQDGFAGLQAECLPWLHERGVAVLGSDGISDALPGPGVPDWPMPIHQVALAGMGVHLLDNLKLDRLAVACAEQSQWEFLFSAAPLRVAGGTGSPLNPVAVL